VQRSYKLWYLLIALLTLGPMGVRVLTWRTPRPRPLEPAMVRAGAELFEHEWTPGDPLAAGGDGLGPVYNATSCVACHSQGGVGGSGGLGQNVTTFTVRPTASGGQAREGVIHAFALGEPETLADAHPGLPRDLRPSPERLVPFRNRAARVLQFPAGVHVSQRNTPALFGVKLIDEVPERDIIANERRERLKWQMAPAQGEALPVGRARRLPDGRVGRFGWKAQTARLSDFVQAACANELGLGNPGQEQPRPLNRRAYQPPGLDLTLEQCNQLTAFCASLPPPRELLSEREADRDGALEGKKLFQSTGCADCHTPDLGPAKGVYSDLLLHRMGETLVGGGSYGEPPVPPPDLPPASEPGDSPRPDEWRTPPLWGVADSAPYLHDGRAATLEEAIVLHGGQGKRAVERFGGLAVGEQAKLVAFLKTLRAP
jgi:CxxC motif-containing protein (DUF1111 family)